MPNIIEELLVPETNKGLFYGGAFHAASQPGEIVVMTLQKAFGSPQSQRQPPRM